MALQSLGEAAGWMAKSPYVWLSGLWTAAVLLLAWYLYEGVGIMTAVSVALVLAFVLPALIAGTYGVVAEGESSFRVFRRYAVHGYFRQLLPSILVFLIAWVISQFVSYILMTFGLGLAASAQVAMFVFIPVVFFCYFADVTAVVNEKRVFASVKDSFLRVMNGSFSVAVFYLVNVVLLIAVSFIGSFVFAAFAADAFLPFTSMTEAELLSLTPDELLAIMSAPEVMFAGFAAIAVCAVFFVPLFTLYKVCYFAKTSALVLPDATVAEPEGEYDEKGRWYKYK
ncbi:hypothetical protein O0S10_01885 [Methanocorpusculum sp. MG]|uniref:DUF4013 domain-containing protein n=1 Tax=Methanocorpusculum petauri TaxID=3002863 RepID=A0ABT4IE13_9EURY|nr:hypothetical protein [Methanocorpusculum petauri]MCZ0859978.1 hypothetical protein [Methanocorpusculum petauri]MDE2443088.1 hypothetical protein [Methanocorpusculum sp.]